MFRKQVTLAHSFFKACATAVAQIRRKEPRIRLRERKKSESPWTRIPWAQNKRNGLTRRRGGRGDGQCAMEKWGNARKKLSISASLREYQSESAGAETPLAGRRDNAAANRPLRCFHVLECRLFANQFCGGGDPGL